MAKKKAEDKLVRISTAAEAAGVSKQTVEYYILLGLIEPLGKQGSQGRYFDEVLIRRIRLIRQLNESGYTLRDIRQTYLTGPSRSRPTGSQKKRRSRSPPK